MPYKNLVAVSCADKKEWFCRARDFLCARSGTYDYSTAGIGWTLHDSSYAVDEDNPAINDWYVVFSPGENGREDLYFYVGWVSGQILVKGYLFWNNTTHAGIHSYNTANNLPFAETGAPELYLYGDLDSFMIWETALSSYKFTAFCGCLINQVYDNTVAQSSSAVGAGTDVVVTLDAVPASWVVGQRLYVYDTTRIDIITIKAISGNTVTADFTFAYLAGCKFRADIPWFCNNSGYSIGVTTAVGHANTTPLSCSPTAGTYGTYAAPDVLNGEYIGAPYNAVGTSSYMGQLPNIYAISAAGLTDGDALDGGYRYLKYYSSFYLAIKEV